MKKDGSRNFMWHCRRSFSILIESIHTFTAAEGQLRASALTYYTLFAIVPIFALFFGVAKGFDLDQWLREELMTRMSEHKEILNRLLVFADTTLNQTKGGLVAGIGALMLCWSVVKMIGNIELAFNRVWKVKKTRTIFRKFTDYLSFLVIAPVMLAAAGSATVMVSRLLREFSEKNTFVSFSRPLIEFGIQCVPYLLVWILFTFIYSFLPNTRVKFKAALFGGVISGTIFQVLQMGYVLVQMALSRYNVIYGSFSALPLFLIWMYLNWLIMLFGVTLCYLFQHFDYDSKRARDCDRTPADKRLLALMIAAEVTNEFAEGKEASTVVELSRKLDISETLTNELLYNLVQSKVLCQIAGPEYDNPSYRPGMPLDKMNIVNVLQKYDQWAEPGHIPAFNTVLGDNTVRSIELLKDVMVKSPANCPLTDLLKK